MPSSLWMIMGMGLISFNYALVKFLSISNTTASIVFYRSVFSILILLVLLRPQKFISSFKTKNLKLNVVRGLCGAAYLFLSVFSLKELNLSMFTALMYLSPMMILVLSCIFLNERWKASYIISSIMGFCGMLLIIQPTGNLNIIYGIAAVFAAFADAVTIFLSKKTAQSDTPQTMIVFYIVITLAASINGVNDLNLGDLNSIFLIFLMSLSHLLSFYCYIKALQKTAASHIAQYEYLVLIFSFSLDYFCFSEFITIPVFSGIGLILTSCFINEIGNLNFLKLKLKFLKDKVYE